MVVYPNSLRCPLAILSDVHSTSISGGQFRPGLKTYLLRQAYATASENIYLPVPWEGDNVFTSFCLSVCLSVHNITQQVINKFGPNVAEVGCAQGKNRLNLLAIQNHNPKAAIF